MTRTIKGENGSCLDVHDRRPVILPSYLCHFRIDDTAGETTAILAAVPEAKLVRVHIFRHEKRFFQIDARHFAMWIAIPPFSASSRSTMYPSDA